MCWPGIPTLPATPGCYAAVLLARVPKPPEGNATITVTINPLDDKGANLPAISTAVRAQAGGWRRIAAAGDIPSEIRGKPVKSVRVIVVVDGFKPDEEVHLDDLALFKLD